PNVDSPTAAGASTTVYTFDGATPGASSWSFVLGDIDADQATISATVQGGGAATGEQLGYQGSYNSCSAAVAGGWSCSADPDGTIDQRHGDARRNADPRSDRHGDGAPRNRVHHHDRR
ncbi:hypothetical protein, partial [Mycobacteroides abscessus]|uniref:hypothetical protein n=1 Tax=Mycobacteroides abscessus TaxID=36809 RepID=UPI001A959F00